MEEQENHVLITPEEDLDETEVAMQEMRGEVEEDDTMKEAVEEIATVDVADGKPTIL